MSKIDDFKAQISLVDFILSHGFRLSDKRRTQKELRVTNGTDTLIVVPVSAGKATSDIYFNVHEDWTKHNSRSIIDFVHEFVLRNSQYTPKNWHEIFTVLNQYLGNELYVHPGHSKFKVAQKESNPTQQFSIKEAQEHLNLNYPNAVSFDYLKSRNITEETFLSPPFRETFGVFYFRFSEDKIYENPAFLYKDTENKLQNIQQIVSRKLADGNMQRSKMFLKNAPRNETLYKGNLIKDKKRVNFLVVCEAPEDCMAHYQLSKNDPSFRDKNNFPMFPYYLATGGFASEQQLEHISKIARELKKTILLAYDNDRMGEIYTLKTMVALAGANTEIKSTTKDNKPTITICFETETLKKQGIENNIFATLNKSFNDVVTEEVLIHQKHQVAMHIVQTTDSVQKLIEFLRVEVKKTTGLKVAVHKPITKDWVEDLERKERLKVKVHEHPKITLIR